MWKRKKKEEEIFKIRAEQGGWGVQTERQEGIKGRLKEGKGGRETKLWALNKGGGGRIPRAKESLGERAV